MFSLFYEAIEGFTDANLLDEMMLEQADLPSYDTDDLFSCADAQPDAELPITPNLGDLLPPPCHLTGIGPCWLDGA